MCRACVRERTSCIVCDVCGSVCAPYGAGARNQYGSCAGACVSVRYASTVFVQCAHVRELVRMSMGICAVCAYKSFV